jgi:RNase adapter protein RapZ
MNNAASRNSLLIVTGLSGAGMTSALKDLEDMGYEVFDNFPPHLVDPLMNEAGKDRPVAVAIDARARGFSQQAVRDLIARHKAKLLFIVADTETLQRRFRETRRKHPLAEDRPVSDGIKRERDLLFGLRDIADILIDTTNFSVHDLRRVMEGHFRRDGAGKLVVSLVSFGFRYGVPREADIVMDIRFLKNPHWEESLRPLTGRDKAVGDYIEQDPEFPAFVERFRALVDPLFPLYRREGKNYLTIAIGCTGGRHRSVYAVEKLAPGLEGKNNTVTVVHRDVERS